MSLFHRPLRVLAAGALCGVVAISLTACSAKPENSPVIRKKLAEVDEMKDQLDQATRLLTSLTGELTVIRDEISNLRAFTPDGDGATAVMNRLETIEKRISEVEVTTTTMASAAPRTSGGSSSNTSTASTSSSSSAPSSNQTASSSSSSAPAQQSRPADAFPRLATVGASSSSSSNTSSAASSGSGSSSSSQQTASASATRSDVRPVAQTSSSSTSNRNQAPAAPAPRGRYYTIQSGDTLEKIASDNGVSVAQLREANRLPSGARPLPGQRLFVPGGN